MVRQTGDPAFPVIPVLMPGCESPPTGFLQLLTWVDLSKGTSVLQQPDSLAALRAALRGEHDAASAVRGVDLPIPGPRALPRRGCGVLLRPRRRDPRARCHGSRQHAFVAVVGPSGSGKSSLVFAGLLPALRKQRRDHDVGRRHAPSGRVAAARPRRRLRSSRRRTLDRPRSTPIWRVKPRPIELVTTRQLARIVNRRLDAAPEKPDRLLIYVDQWEELYAMAPAAEDKSATSSIRTTSRRFIALLVAAASGAGSRASVVLTVRADFYNPLIRNPFLSALLPRQQVNIKPMGVTIFARDRDAGEDGRTLFCTAEVGRPDPERRRNAGRPAAAAAVRAEGDLGEARGNTLTAEAYTEVGGVTGAIEKTAEDRLRAVNGSAEGRGTASLSSPRYARRRAGGYARAKRDSRRSAATRGHQTVLRSQDPAFGDRLRTAPRTGQAGSDGRATVEVAHEALIQRWPTLRDWVAQNRENLRARAAVLRALAEWEENGGIDKFLLDPGVQLERGRALVESPGDVPVDDVRHYVELSIKREEGRVNAEREAYLADQKRIADAERKAREAAEEVARRAGASAKVEIELRTTAEQKTLAEQGARLHAESSAGKLRAALIAAVIALGIAAVAFYATSQEVDETQRQLVRANHISAQSINRDLAGPLPRTLSARERNALWNLAQAEEGVKYEFVSKLADSPEEIARVSDRFALIFRALGLLGPSPFEALELLHAASDFVGHGWSSLCKDSRCASDRAGSFGTR